MLIKEIGLIGIVVKISKIFIISLKLLIEDIELSRLRELKTGPNKSFI